MMLVRELRTLGFRNLATGAAELSDGITLVWGENGAGKTNLLEALYAGLAGRSPRTRSERETIAFGEPLARVEVGVEDVDPASRARSPGTVRLRTFLFAISRDGERRHLIDGAPAGPEHQELRPPISMFMPDRLILVKGPPAARRAHLDRFWAALWPVRAATRRRYGRALAQRNALLGRLRAGAGTRASLDAWDRELANAGIELMELRAGAAERAHGPFARAAAELGLPGEAELRYRPRSDASAPDQLATELAERRESDIARGFTTHGPHLDDLALLLDGRSVRRYASQGQQRAALLALLFSEREALVSEGRPPPLMLLDDVASELDPGRRRLLCERLERGGGQSVITATEPSQLPAACAVNELAVRGGSVIAGAPDATAAA
jgi:DNA replication and repair protein RecF